MDLAVLTGFLATLASLCGLFFAIYTVRQMKNKLESFEETASSVGQFFRFEQNEEGEVMLDTRMVGMIKALSSSLATSLKMSMLGSLSGPARLDKGLKGAIAQDVVEEKMPMLNLIGDFLGINTKKYIGKHPEAMLQLYQQFAPMLGKMKIPGAGPPQNRGNDGVGYA